MKKTLAMLLTSALCISLLASCSSTDTGTDSGSTGGTSDSSNSTPDNSTTENTEGGTIMMANGEQDLPAEYGNFAILDWGYLDHLFMLDAVPVASPITAEPAADASDASKVSYADGYGRFYPDRSVFDGIEPINASDDGIDFEQLVSLKPNYIITSEGNIEYADKLNAIATTYFLPSALSTDEDGYKDWKQIHMALAQLVGKVDKAEENIKEYDDLVASYVESNGSMEGKTAIVTQISTKGVQSSLATNHPHIFVHYGFELPDGFPAGETLALETLVSYDPDYLFINVESWEDFATYEASPIWQNLTAVQNGNVFEFAHNVWNRSNGSLAAKFRVTDIGDFLADGTQVTNRFNYISE
ncbi:MAG: ABC transporter substrate-binding protein [Eubacteriales bacterium]